MPDELNANVEDYAEAWIPDQDKGPNPIIGKVTDIGQLWSDEKNAMYAVITIEDEGQDPIFPRQRWAVHCFRAIIEAKVMEMRPQVGERILIKQLDKTPTKDGRRMKVPYILKIEGRQADVYGNLERQQAGPGQSTAKPSTELVEPEDLSSDMDEAPF